MNNSSLTPQLVSRHALAFMAEHGLVGWAFRFNTNKRTLGKCYQLERRIELSVHVLQHGWIQVEETIRHEVAHALTNPWAEAHGPEWQANAIRLGARPVSCAAVRLVAAEQARYQATCPRCGKVFGRHRMPTRQYLCRVDRSPLTFVDTLPDRHERRQVRRDVRRKIRTARGRVR